MRRRQARLDRIKAERERQINGAPALQDQELPIDMMQLAVLREEHGRTFTYPWRRYVDAKGYRILAVGKLPLVAAPPLKEGEQEPSDEDIQLLIDQNCAHLMALYTLCPMAKLQTLETGEDGVTRWDESFLSNVCSHLVAARKPRTIAASIEHAAREGMLRSRPIEELPLERVPQIEIPPGSIRITQSPEREQ